jgi:hypothetical protein
LCEVCKNFHIFRLNIYAAAAHFELHLPLLQVSYQILYIINVIYSFFAYNNFLIFRLQSGHGNQGNCPLMSSGKNIENTVCAIFYIVHREYGTKLVLHTVLSRKYRIVKIRLTMNRWIGKNRYRYQCNLFTIISNKSSRSQSGSRSGKIRIFIL